ncbi:archaemetzincin [Rubripirellula amarantea]|nr:archaemetzincin [Rubripirellula amarantea]
MFLLSAMLVAAIAASLFLRSNGHSDDGTSFRPPSAVERSEAVGNLGSLAESLQIAFDPQDQSFAPIPKPGLSDWLANQQELGQTFQQYVRSHPNRPNARRQTIYLQPIGDIDSQDGPSLDQLVLYAESFFSLPVKLLPAVADDRLPFTERLNAGNRQILSTDILRWLESRVPDDAFCLLAVTMVDLYPDDQWNFVFGQASLTNRVGVYSFVRYRPDATHQEKRGGSQSLMLRRSCKVLSHETGHMFGLKHCVYFRCLMNGSNHLDEADAQPNHLCPVCLRKLQWACKFDVADRYSTLKRFAETAQWEDEALWLQRRCASIDPAR